MARTVPIGVLVLTFSVRAAAEPKGQLTTGVDVIGGVATAPFYSDNLPEATGHGAVFVARGSWHASNDFGFGVAVPAVSINVRQPAGSYVNEAALGNPLLWAERRWKFEPFEGWLRFGVGVPLAEFGPDRLLYENRALAIADAIGGWHDRELFAAGLVPAPLTLGGALDHGMLEIDAVLKLVPMLRIHDASLESDKAHAFAFFALAGMRAMVRPLGWFGAGVHAHLAIDAAPQASSPRERTLQPVLRPELEFRVGEHFELRADVAIPIAGALGGESVGVGIHASVIW